MNYDNLHYYNNLSSPQFHTDPSLKHISSTQGPHLFSTQKSSVQHQKLLSSTHPSAPNTPYFHTPLSSTHPSVLHIPQFKHTSVQVLVFGVELRGEWN